MTEAAAGDSPYKKFVVNPQLIEHGKTTQMLVATPALNLRVQVIAEGGEDALHSHAGSDAAWYVLDGEASFYGENDVLIAKLGKNQGLLIPHDSPYWFGSSGKENLVILRFGATVDEQVGDTPTHLVEPHFKAEVTAPGVASFVGTVPIEGRYFGAETPA